MKENLPNNTDSLFKEEVDQQYGAWLKNPANKFFLYSEGYKTAGHKLYEFIVENSFYQTSLVYPLIFVYRQFIELRLKELIVMGYDYLKEGKDFPDEHSLLKLWNLYRKELLPQIDKIDDEILDNMERVISQFNTEDPKSMTFRYPVTKAPDRKDSLNRETIDLKNFKEVMEKVILFFDWQWDMISSYKQLRDEMLSNMYRDYY